MVRSRWERAVTWRRLTTPIGRGGEGVLGALLVPVTGLNSPWFISKRWDLEKLEQEVSNTALDALAAL